MRQLNVMYLPHPLDEVNEAWGGDLLAAIGDHHDIRVFDRDLPAEPQFEDAEAIVDVGGNIRAEWVDVAKNAGVKFLQVQTNGLDHVEVDKIRDSGMMLAHCPGELSSVALAEGAMMFILMLAHRHGDAQRNFAAGKVFFPMGLELVDRKLGIVGFGASGQELARRAKAFGMQIMAVDVRPIEPEVLDEIQPDILTGSDALDRLIGESDFISVHLHLTEKTRHIIDERRIKLIKPSACIINVARGELIDEEALYRALLDGRIGGAGLDAFAQEPPDPTRPVYQLPNVCVTPHTVGSTDGTSRKRALFAAENLDRYARGEEVLARVF
jgi:phosphoglycerate dehydrogenase-like enzyme|tara:strand:- start:4182 stop:5159 length:978 start_codon:yes stop_codon:yes gene_type:complete